MVHLDKIIGVSAVVLGLSSMAGMLSTDAYLHGAQVDASGYDAFTHLIVSDGSNLCLNDAAPANSRTATSDRALTQ
jgi:hypothetical protein